MTQTDEKNLSSIQKQIEALIPDVNLQIAALQRTNAETMQGQSMWSGAPFQCHKGAIMLVYPGHIRPNGRMCPGSKHYDLFYHPLHKLRDHFRRLRSCGGFLGGKAAVRVS